MSSKDLKNPCTYEDRLIGGQVHIAFDFDGTLLPQAHFPDLGDPYEWVYPLFKTLVEHGCKVWVYSARFNHDFYDAQADVWFSQVTRWLKEWGLDMFCTLTPYKPPADIIFDDRGQKLEGSKPEDLRHAMKTINILKWKSGEVVEFPPEIYKFIREND